jgi:hypothetical protein
MLGNLTQHSQRILSLGWFSVLRTEICSRWISYFLILQNPPCHPANRAGSALAAACDLIGSGPIQMQQKAQLILELLTEFSAHQPMRDHSKESLALLIGQATVLQAPTHLRARSDMPAAL